MMVLLLASACKKVEPAPTDLDGLLHYLWTWWDDGTDEQIAEAARNLHAAVDGDTLDDTMDGTLTDLDSEDGAMVREGVNSANAQGIFMVRPFDCDLETLDDLVIAPDQQTVHPDAYDSYERTYTSDLNAYASRDVPTLSWDVDYAASVVGASFSAKVKNDLRYVPDQGEELTPWGAMLLARYYMPDDATFDGNGNKTYTQDYEVEFWFERAPGEILHAYAIWRAVDFGYADLSNSSVQRLVLNALSDWDDETEAACAAR